jgi:hypothetical protein
VVGPAGAQGEEGAEAGAEAAAAQASGTPGEPTLQLQLTIPDVASLLALIESQLRLSALAASAGDHAAGAAWARPFEPRACRPDALCASCDRRASGDSISGACPAGGAYAAAAAYGCAGEGGVCDAAEPSSIAQQRRRAEAVLQTFINNRPSVPELRAANVLRGDDDEPTAVDEVAQTLDAFLGNRPSVPELRAANVLRGDAAPALQPAQLALGRAMARNALEGKLKARPTPSQLAPHLRPDAVHHMRQQGPPRQHHQCLVAAAHAPRLSTGQHHSHNTNRARHAAPL